MYQVIIVRCFDPCSSGLCAIAIAVASSVAGGEFRKTEFFFRTVCNQLRDGKRRRCGGARRVAHMHQSTLAVLATAVKHEVSNQRSIPLHCHGTDAAKQKLSAVTPATVASHDS